MSGAISTPLRVTELVLDGVTNQPYPQMATANLSIAWPAGRLGQMEHLILEMVNLADTPLTVTIKAGSWGNHPPLANAPQDLVVEFGASGEETAQQIIGPFSRHRFLQTNGKFIIGFQAASGNPNVYYRAYQVPKI